MTHFYSILDQDGLHGHGHAHRLPLALLSWPHRESMANLAKGPTYTQPPLGYYTAMPRVYTATASLPGSLNASACISKVSHVVSNKAKTQSKTQPLHHLRLNYPKSPTKSLSAAFAITGQTSHPEQCPALDPYSCPPTEHQDDAALAVFSSHHSPNTIYIGGLCGSSIAKLLHIVGRTGQTQPAWAHRPHVQHTRHPGSSARLPVRAWCLPHRQRDSWLSQ